MQGGDGSLACRNLFELGRLISFARMATCISGYFEAFGEVRRVEQLVKYVRFRASDARMHFIGCSPLKFCECLYLHIMCAILMLGGARNVSHDDLIDFRRLFGLCES